VLGDQLDLLVGSKVVHLAVLTAVQKDILMVVAEVLLSVLVCAVR
jgi:hypothetical protein